MSASILATTYNQPKDLELYLLSLKNQTNPGFEIVIADDGSGPETKAVIESFRPHFGARLKHVWHEDQGYRKTKILNKAIAASAGAWLIFTDSDLIVHPRFIADHLRQAAPRKLFMGRRVDLSPAVSEWVRKNPHEIFDSEFYLRTFMDSLRAKGTRNVNRGFRIANPVVSKVLGMHRVPDLLGSNFSISRSLLEELNGFNESLEHYWGEDGDLFVRARNAGATIEGRKSYAVQFHLWHALRQPKPDAETWYRNLLQNKNYVRCENGLVK